jgi:hypothetical protein
MDVKPKALSSKEHLVPLALYQMTPKTNCGDCGLASCLAFATQVVKGEIEVDKCPHLDQRVKESVRSRVASQLAEGFGLKKEDFQIPLDYLFEEFRKIGLDNCAQRHGLFVEQRNGKRGLILPYLSFKLFVTENDISVISGDIVLDPWEKVFVLNYLIRKQGKPSGEWVGLEHFPGSISKIRNIRLYCEKPLSEVIAGRLEDFVRRVKSLDARIIKEESADICLQFDVFPDLSIRILFWDAQPEEGFEARVKFLFDKNVLSIIDLESLSFVCQKLTDRILEAVKE